MAVRHRLIVDEGRPVMKPASRDLIEHEIHTIAVMVSWIALANRGLVAEPCVKVVQLRVPAAAILPDGITLATASFTGLDAKPKVELSFTTMKDAAAPPSAPIVVDDTSPIGRWTSWSSMR